MIQDVVTPLDRTQHLLGNHHVSVDGMTAAARCYFQAQHLRRGTTGGDTYLVGGTYTDRLLMTTEGWRITHRRLEVTWTDGNPEVLHPRGRADA
ncbi:hypothetical protein GCM10009790_35830 [Georgenia ruanii]|uniref:SnoaL-like domain-containing protein n=1 Tax=Georgenia ruanii TaxID=348442 RepID=A0A7J9V1B4_9MICO|nr:nuclear transport factor 2 family protein [Georgenia ruanii]MPV90482.1 hypothetical protein [Georgenia ruanii]